MAISAVAAWPPLGHTAVPPIAHTNFLVHGADAKQKPVVPPFLRPRQPLTVISASKPNAWLTLLLGDHNSASAMPPTGGAPGTGCARGATLLLLVLALSVTGAVASRAALTATALDPVARWYVVEDTLPPELLADTYNPHITIGDVIGHFANAPDNTEYWDTHW